MINRTPRATCWLRTAPAAGLLLAAGLTSATSADFVGISVENCGNCDPADGLMTACVYAVFNDPNDQVTNVTSGQICAPSGFHHNSYPGEDLSALPLPAWWADISLTPDCDSYVTIGLDALEGNNVGLAPDFSDDFVDGGCLFGTWFVTPDDDQGLAGPEQRVLLARLTYPVGEYITGFMDVTYIDGDTGNPGFGNSSFEFFGETEPRLHVMIDRTGSMNAIRPATGNSRCEDAVLVASSDVFTWSILNPTGLIAVSVFSGDAPTALTDYVGWPVALATISGLDPEGCSGNTPLADALCMASSSLIGSTVGDRTLLVTSDGEENNSTGPCSGPDSLTGPPPPGNYDAGSWQQQVYDSIVDSMVVSLRHWDELAVGATGSPPSHSNSREEADVAESGQGVSDAVFFRDLAESSGGRYSFYADTDPLPDFLGACCLPNGTCMEDQSATDCQVLLGGDWAGEGIDCSACIMTGINRSVSAISVVPSSSGQTQDVVIAWRVDADVQTYTDAGTYLKLSVNNVGVDARTVEVSADPFAGNCDNCPSPNTCVCAEPNGPCSCSSLALTTTFPDVDINPGDTVSIFINKSPGAMDDEDISDNSKLVVYSGEDIYWDRRVIGVDSQPSQGNPGFFDVFVEIQIGWSGIVEPTDLGTRLQIIQDGIVYAQLDIDGFAIPGQSPCGGDIGICEDTGCGWWNGGLAECEMFFTYPDYLLGCECTGGIIVVEFVGVPVDPASDYLLEIIGVPGESLPALPNSEIDDLAVIDFDECRGDLDSDGLVGITDLLAVLAAWGPCPGCPEDLTGDFEVDINDLLTLLAVWGQCP